MLAQMTELLLNGAAYTPALLMMGAMKGPPAASSGYPIGNSIVPDGGADYLSRTFSAGGTNQYFNIKVKRCELGAEQGIYSVPWVTGVRDGRIIFQSDDTLRILDQVGASGNNRVSNRKFRDTHAHGDLFVAIEPGAGAAEDRIRAWWNGEEITWATNTNAHTSTCFDDAVAHEIGRKNVGGGSNYLNAIISECMRSDDGAGITVASFGEFDENSQWRSIDPSGADFGAEGFRLNFAIAPGTGNGAGEDVSGNGNHWTENSLTAAQQSTDTPTNNFATLNPLMSSSDTPTEGNLTVLGGLGNKVYLTATQPLTFNTYWEIRMGGAGNTTLGVLEQDTSSGAASVIGGSAGQWGWYSNGNKYDEGSSSVYGTASTADDIYRVAWEASTGKLWLGDDSGWFASGNPETGANPMVTTDIPSVTLVDLFIGLGSGNTDATLNLGQKSSGTGGNADENGYGDFEYAVPASFFAQCTNNIAAPVVANSEDEFVDALDTETNIEATLATARSGFTNYVDLLINRDAAEQYWRFSHDSSNEHTQGATSTHQTKSTLSGANNWAGYSFKIDGLAKIRAGSVSHTNGADTTVSYTDVGTARCIILIFERGTSVEVPMYHPDLTAGDLVYITATSGETLDAAIKTVTSSSFKIDTGETTGTYDYLVIPEVTGFSDLFLYTGNGLADGPFVAVGISPRFIWNHKFSAADGWVLIDDAREPSNGVGGDKYFRTDDPTAIPGEGESADYMDWNSTGFKCRATASEFNGSGATFAGLLIGSPFGGIGVAPATAR